MKKTGRLGPGGVAATMLRGSTISQRTQSVSDGLAAVNTFTAGYCLSAMTAGQQRPYKPVAYALGSLSWQRRALTDK